LEVVVGVLDGGTAADCAPDEGVPIAERVGHFVGVHAFDGDVHGAVRVEVAAVDLFFVDVCVFLCV
jgi:hypothetical protein